MEGTNNSYKHLKFALILEMSGPNVLREIWVFSHNVQIISQF